MSGTITFTPERLRVVRAVLAFGEVGSDRDMVVRFLVEHDGLTQEQAEAALADAVAAGVVELDAEPEADVLEFPTRGAR